MKKSKNKKMIVMAVLLALFIVVGGTFAWFTSKDEVTNKLTAQNDYGVSIVEDFTPPGDWTPGQEVNKDVYVTNTGNVDAFVKVALSNSMSLTTVAAGGAYAAGDVSSYLTLSTDTNANEVKALCAGGRLVCSAGTAITDESEQIKYGTDFTPTDSGLYVFERDVEDGKTAYAGYYYSDNAYYAVTDIKKEDAQTFTYKMLVKSEQSLDASAIELDYTGLENSNVITAVYQKDDADKMIKINITLASDWKDNWTLLNNNVFYYNNTIKAGTTSAQLVDKLELDDEVKNSAYYKFDYNLKVTADSVQVVNDESGKQTAEAVTDAWTEAVAAPQYAGNDTNIISSVTWTAKSVTP